MPQSTHQARSLLAYALFAAATGAGCTGKLSGPTDPDNGKGADGAQEGEDTLNGQGSDKPGQLGITRDSVASACESRAGVLGVGLTKLRRLSLLEFNNTVMSLFGGAYVDYREYLPDDEPMGPFVSNQTLSVGTQEARQYRTVAQLVAEDTVAAGVSFLPCALPTNEDTTCIMQFISEIAPRAFRRPLEPGEAEGLLALYTLGRDGIDGESPVPENGLKLLLRAIVGSPDLIYVVDTGASGVPKDIAEPLNAHALASRLALAFWNGPPDAELTKTAESGELLNNTVYQAQVARLLNDPRAQVMLAHFFSELTGVDELLFKEKDPALFPQYGEALAQEMLSEQANFVKDVVFNGDGLLRTLLTTNYANPGPLVAAIYGGSPPPVGQRQGIFTQAAYITAHNKPSETSPVHLGINIREAILCETMPPPPPGVDTTLPQVTGEVRTSRERFALHETGPCKSCHELIDPIGLAFEHYDPIGAYRLTDNGGEIDPTGQIISSISGEPGPFFTGALELSDQLADSIQVQDCVARQMLRSALSRQESVLDACTALDLIEAFDASGGNIRELLATIAQTDAFKNILLNPQGDTP